MKRDDPADDPLVQGPIEQALAAYQGLLSPGDLEEMRELLEDVVVAHPVGAALRKRLGPAKAPLQSEEKSIEDGASDEPADRRSAGSKG